MASKEYIGIARLTYVFGLLKNLFDAKADASDLADKVLPAYGTCATAASERVKVVTIADNSWSLKTGCIIGVKFTYDNTYSATAGNPIQLNVNSSGTKNVYYGTSDNPIGANTSVFGKAGVVIFYQYDGTNWVWLSCGELPSSSGGGGGSNVDISEANYNLLPAADKTNGSTYYVS